MSDYDCAAPPSRSSIGSGANASSDVLTEKLDSDLDCPSLDSDQTKPCGELQAEQLDLLHTSVVKRDPNVSCPDDKDHTSMPATKSTSSSTRFVPISAARFLEEERAFQS